MPQPPWHCWRRELQRKCFPRSSKTQLHTQADRSAYRLQHFHQRGQTAYFDLDGRFVRLNPFTALERRAQTCKARNSLPLPVCFHPHIVCCCHAAPSHPHLAHQLDHYTHSQCRKWTPDLRLREAEAHIEGVEVALAEAELAVVAESLSMAQPPTLLLLRSHWKIKASWAR